MKNDKTLLASLAFATLCTSVTAQAGPAGPAVTVTFKNLGSEVAEYKPVTRNEISARLNAKSPINSAVPPGGSDTYSMQSTLSPDTSYASVRYVMGSKVCVFSTTFIKLPGAGGAKVPKWNRTANSEGGAVCTATSRATNLSTYAWAAEFTMK
ncbi:hypothetical protein NLO85_17935 [Pseudomonas savastanoi]|nr:MULTISPECIES: hypothetical protein [Pseudomonas]KAA3545146.1 hypothetical protein DXU85_12435 [Pseudomonas savastanoi]MCQ3022411.1 hypothetical protein [Pseudomonas savastanoi]PAB27564.1 hypothetical protein CC205_23260 [Pseudomonas savastanoi pv. nerii]PAB34905.1 hypothetical protein CC202_07040 [Pseudomonas savastanoi]RML97519.1 hypothetical protein ALQ88_01398 [Pseudomonas savastanoi]